MSLVSFTSDRGMGYSSTTIYIESTEVAAIEPITDRYSRSDNRTIITMKTGEKRSVIDSIDAIALKLKGS